MNSKASVRCLVLGPICIFWLDISQGTLRLGFRVGGLRVGPQRKSDKQFQDPKDRKAWGQKLLVSKHWPVAPWSCAAVIQERADKGNSDVRVFFFLNPESRENARSGIKAPKRAQRRRKNQN